MKRRTLLKVLAAFTAGTMGPRRLSTDQSPLGRFKLGSISDEWSQDLEEALRLMRSYGLRWVELRTLWGGYNTETTPAQVQRIKELLNKYEFTVSVLDTALYKCDLPGTTNVAGEKDMYPYGAQMDLLNRAIERAQTIGTDKLRVFSFWRVADPRSHFSRIAEDLARSAEVARAARVQLVLENESACNVATGQELAAMLRLVPSANFGANWDTGNGYWHGETSFPDGYAAVPKSRVWHMHIKDVHCNTAHQDCRTVVVGTGQVDLEGEFRAFLRDGYNGTMSLEPEVETPGMPHLEATKRSLEGLLKMMREAIS